ncbi:MAG: PSD1 and planctomycete cytochrome C domain-containing protein [Gemmatimonadetes bacterium]|nr:PSD1 and planctomycete cytochrome C domain-containing protein [Gemmatimonadota bacterium]
MDAAASRRALTSIRPRTLAGAVAALALLGFATVGWPRGHQVDFNTEVRPILNEKCISCHGGVKRAGGFGVLFREDALAKTESGRFGVVPGDADASEMIRRITHADPSERMPREGPALSEREIETLERWIEQGAKWGDHWAYVKPGSPSLPRVSDAEWARGGIDRFVLARLDAEELSPSRPAECAALLRRVTLDLTGLPAKPEEAAAFCRDPSQPAYERAVDQLLASPAYGEHWAAMWLDLARYGDTKGYEKDSHRDMWSYRDWVIRALNADLPFDQFTIEQLAGDLLPGATDQQILATGFHRNTSTNDEGGTDDEEFRVAAVIDRVNTTWEVWQGTTMGCVQCHSHPYDPFRHEEYYKLFAFFNNTADEDRTDDAPRLATYLPEQHAELRAHLARAPAAVRVRPRGATAALADEVEKVLYPLGRIPAPSLRDSMAITRTADFVVPDRDGAYVGYGPVELSGVGEIGLGYGGNGRGSVEVRIGSPTGRLIATAVLPGPPPPRPAPAVRAPVGPAGKPAPPPRPKPPGRPTRRSMEPTLRVPIARTEGRHALYLVMRAPEKPAYRLTSLSLYPALDPGSSRALQSSAGALAAVVPEAETPVLRELPPAFRRVTQVFDRGNWLLRADTVQPGVPGSMPPLKAGRAPDRLDLANWLVAKENPLTARVFVNRLWKQCFGTGLSKVLEDVGSQGESPSHPELLDWMAVRFMDEHDWSIKALLKEIVLSCTYRQSSRVTPELRERDPYNRLLARGPRVRLSAEQVRDQALAVSGILSPKMYGPSVMPPQPPGLWSSPYSSAAWVTAEGEDRYRRAVYTYWKRTVPYPSLVTFDAPTRDVVVSRRIRTNTPLQALVTLNDPVYVEAAQALARQMLRGAGETDGRLRTGFRRALGREPDQATLTRLRGLHQVATRHYRARPELLDGAVEPYMPYDTAGGYAAVPPHGLLGRAAAYARAPAERVELAALTTVAGAILNLDEFLTKE